METLNLVLGILASLLAIYSFYLNRKSEKTIKELNDTLIENKIITKNSYQESNSGHFNKQAISGENGVSVIGKGNNVTKRKDKDL